MRVALQRKQLLLEEQRQWQLLLQHLHPKGRDNIFKLAWLFWLLPQQLLQQSRLHKLHGWP
jgi:hypothetical protein